MPDRIYSDREVAAIIERAADRQRRAPLRDDTTGLTLAEIERAGREAGLDPALLRSAAAELDAGTLAIEESHSMTSVAERWVEGPLRAGAWEDEVAALRLRFGASAAPTWGGPDVTDLGVDREWTHTAMAGDRTTVTVSPRGDRTRIRVVRVAPGFDDPRVHGAALGAVLALAPSLLAGGFAAEVLGLGDLAGVAVLLLVFMAGLALGATHLAGRTARRRARLAEDAEALADDMARRLVADEAGPPASAGPSEAPRIDAALLDAEEGEAPEGTGERGRRARA